ncbi:cysteine-rich and transmembrane domain-containing protein WIH2-like [Chenopodium quinoa]|uniref:cysteine-rich and transmembrane domain-containing protein WIH2-like n=1 Tax=Chenopodium quinoa TaxID=63459 RepID=UPI000B76CF4B|nr:cysteine-rich and transmembrane domain-containing protein WIH2-like [Chenopodium quinoa]
MSYSNVTHVGHESYPPSQGWYPGPETAPPPPPRPGFEQGYGSRPPPGPGYQGYFSDNYPPPVSHVHHSGPTHYPYQQPYEGYDYSYDSGCPSFLRACVTALCCCCVLEQCCSFW